MSQTTVFQIVIWLRQKKSQFSNYSLCFFQFFPIKILPHESPLKCCDILLSTNTSYLLLTLDLMIFVRKWVRIKQPFDREWRNNMGWVGGTIYLAHKWTIKMAVKTQKTHILWTDQIHFQHRIWHFNTGGAGPFDICELPTSNTKRC